MCEEEKKPSFLGRNLIACSKFCHNIQETAESSSKFSTPFFQQFCHRWFLRKGKVSLAKSRVANLTDKRQKSNSELTKGKVRLRSGGKPSKCRQNADTKFCQLFLKLG